MFVNDVLGLCRGNYFTGDVFGTQIPNTVGAFGQVPFGQIPFGYGFNTGINHAFGAGFNPAFSAGFNPAFGTGFNPTFGTGINPAFGAGINPAFSTGINPAFAAGIHTAFGTGFNPGFNTGWNTANFGGGAFHPVYGYLVNRVPQNFVHQGVVPQTLGNVNTLGGQQVLPIFGQHTSLTNPVLAQGGIGNIGYGLSPLSVANWNWSNPGIQSQICR